MDREAIWTAAISAGYRSARDHDRIAWNDDDWRAMIEEFDRQSPPLELMPTAIIRAEVKRRVVHGRKKPKNERPCVGCGALLGARERRTACPMCGARNPRK